MYSDASYSGGDNVEAITIYTAINYSRQTSLSEKALSTISNYFYLGGTKVTVIKGDEVQVETGQVAWYEAAAKVASYILLFPLTLTLCAVGHGLRSGHTFTVLTLPQPVIEQNKPEPPLAPMVETAQAIKEQQPEICIAPPRVQEQEEIFHPFAITISEESSPQFNSKNEMLLKAQELGKQVLAEHRKLKLTISADSDGQKQVQSFIKELEKYVDADWNSWRSVLSISPKKQESAKDGQLVRTYTNGIVEEVDSSKPNPTESFWYGKRIYPDGVIESGGFDDFIWYNGKRVEQERTLYRRPKVGLQSYSQNRYAVCSEVDGVKQVIFLQRWLGTGDFVEIKEESVPMLAAMLKEEYCREEFLREILSGPIDCEQFIQYLFHENKIFYLGAYTVGIILSLVQENKFAINLRQKNPETNKTLLTSYPADGAITQTILELDPTLCDEAEPILVNQFEDKLKSFSGHRDHASSLFKQIPKSFMLHEVVDCIFKQFRFGKEITTLIHALEEEFPSFKLSGCDTIRLAIVEDKDQTLTNEQINSMFKEHNITDNVEEMASCYDLAYRMDHPYIYPVAGKTTLPNEYTINFLWINLNPQDRTKDSAEHIFKDGLDPSENADLINDAKQLEDLEESEKTLPKDELESWMKVKTSYMYRLAKWAEANPGAQINLWYDSALVTEKARTNTFEMMKRISQSRSVKLKLRDLRYLPQCTGEIENLFHPGVPVYFRVDLLKVLIADELLLPSVDETKYCIVTDIDVEPMTPQHMFDQRTVDYLSNNGYVFNRVGLSDFENSFFIFNKKNNDIQKAQQETVIQKIVSRTTKQRGYPIDTNFKSEKTLGSQSVFSRYSSFKYQMGEVEGKRRDKAPRKVVKCPASQFGARIFFDTDHQKETFRFIGESNVPYTRFGRNKRMDCEAQIPELQNWTAQPLPPSHQ